MTIRKDRLASFQFTVFFKTPTETDEEHICLYPTKLYAYDISLVLQKVTILFILQRRKSETENCKRI